jgi:hypothetical protein
MIMLKQIYSIRFFVAVLATCGCLAASAQAPKYFTVQPGQNLKEVIPVTEFYEYPQFSRGFVFFRGGNKSQSRLNYNVLHEELFFMNAKGDTLTLVNPEEVRVVAIDKDSFYFDGQRFVKIDTIIGDAKLATASFFVPVSERKQGAYGTTTDAITNYYSSYVMPGITKLDLVPQVVTTYVRSKAIFIGDKYNKFEPISKESVLKFYSSKSAKLKSYLKQNKVNFSDRKDILALISYMNLAA